MLNKFWTLMNRGKTCSEGRAVDETSYKFTSLSEPMHSILVPDTDARYSSSCTEQLLQAILSHSYYGPQLLLDDPCNTYSKDILALETSSYAELSNTSGMSMLVLDEGSSLNWGQRTFGFSIDTAAMEASVTATGAARTYAFTYADGLTNKIPMDTSLYLRMQGTLPGSPFTFSIAYKNAFTRSISAVVDNLAKQALRWQSPSYRQVFDQSSDDMDRICAVTMNLYQILKNG